MTERRDQDPVPDDEAATSLAGETVTSSPGASAVAHAAADPESCGVCLNTEVERNVGFYTRHGFEVIMACGRSTLRRG